MLKAYFNTLANGLVSKSYCLVI